MSSQFAYVCEPDVINISVIKDYLVHEWQVERGNVNFTDSKKYPYSVLIIRSETRIDKTIKKRFPHLHSIIRVGTGLDNIDLNYCKENDITVYNAAGANAAAVAEYILAMSLYVLRNIRHLAPEDVLSWNRFKFRGASICEQSIGLVGFGHIGKLLCTTLKSMGCNKISVYDPYIDPSNLPEGVKYSSSLGELFKHCNMVTIQVPLSDATRNIIGTKEFANLSDNSFIVNVSHGGVVDEAALLSELSKRPAFLYVADGATDEPHPQADFVNHPNVILTPHIASLTGSAEQAMVEKALDNFLHSRVTKL